ncbi:MAG: hypothetical protein ACFFFT_11810 [Candidatus Thorarchaeota archaeon]
MADSKLEPIENDSKKGTIREKIKFQYFWYLIILITNYLGSLIIPTFLFMTYFFLFFMPYFLKTTNFFAIFTEFRPFITLISMPLVLIGCYLLRLFFIGLITRSFWKWSEKQSPSKDGIIPRNFPSRVLKFYHIRSFLIKYGKNLFTKGAFPWLSNWFYNFVGSSKIGKGTTIEESVSNDKYINVGKNCYIGVNSALANHVVEGIFGNISYFKIKIGDNVTAAASNFIGPGSEVRNDSYLLPIASTPKFSLLRGKAYYFSGGAKPLKRIFKKKIQNLLKIDPKNTEQLGFIEDSNASPQIKSQNQNEDVEMDLSLDFTTSSAISRVNIKFLALYISIFWFSGLPVAILFYTYIYYVQNLFIMIFFLPAMIIIMFLTFILGCFFFCKLFLILINLIHKPKEGIFRAELGNKDFEFWKLRIELKKIVLWLMRNWPIPWADVLAFRWFGMKMDFSSNLYDSWCDSEFIQLGRNVLIGQGATIMSSMVVGKYLIIKKIIFDDYVLIGGMTTIAPGTIVGKETLVGAISNTIYNQLLEPGWVYFGIPVRKLKKNKYAESQREIIMKRDVDEEKKYEIEHEINVDEDKKDLT